MKICSKCGIEKDDSEFNIDKNKKDRLYPSCKDCVSVKNAKCRQVNKDKAKAIQAEWRRTNKDKARAYVTEYQRNRRKSDPLFKLTHNLRSRLYMALKGKLKSASTMQLVGCTIDFLKSHLEFQFAEGMTWDNYGQWHIDHIRPCASFDLSDDKQQQECFHYSNLQPLWATDNLSKSDTYEV